MTQFQALQVHRCSSLCFGVCVDSSRVHLTALKQTVLHSCCQPARLNIEYTHANTTCMLCNPDHHSLHVISNDLCSSQLVESSLFVCSCRVGICATPLRQLCNPPLSESPPQRDPPSNAFTTNTSATNIFHPFSPSSCYKEAVSAMSSALIKPSTSSPP